jgi:ribosomal protein S27AE
VAPPVQAALAKVCSTCKAEKPLDQFHRNATGRLGRMSRCKPCACRYVREYRAAHVEEYRARGREADRTPERREHWKARRVRRGERGRIQSHAHSAVQGALRAGKLKPSPCESCGAAEVDAHHDDYAKPLDVRWLCRLCHAAHHKREADAARAARERSLAAVANRRGA